MEEQTKSPYSKNQVNVATGFYILFVVAFIVLIVGIIWMVVDWLLGDTKISSWFLTLQFGLQIMIIGGLFAGLFFIIVFFFGFFRRGRKRILQYTFKAKDVDESYKNRTDIKVIAFGFLISIIIVIVGVVIFILMIALTLFTQLDPSQTLTTFSNSTLCLLIGITLFILDGLSIFFINFLKNGYYFVLKMIGGLERED
jgi:hypothetical protein